MPDLEFFQVLIWTGRTYQFGLFLYGTYLLSRNRLWLLQGVFVAGAACYVAYTILARVGVVPAATQHRVLSIYGNAICFHVLLLVIHTLTKRQSLGRLRPFDDAA